METNPDFNRCVSFIKCQFSPVGEKTGSGQQPEIKPVITITRQTGSGGNLLANKLSEYLQQRVPTHCSWAVFDQNIVESVLQEHNLPKEMARYMTEDKRSFISDLIEEMFGLHPSSWILVRQTAETILHLAQAGNVILVGRAANVITNKIPHTFHVRLVGSFDVRVKRIVELSKMSQKEAEQFIKREDEARINYLKHYFDKDPNDPLLYHLIINTDKITPQEAAVLVGEAVIRRFNLLNEQRHEEPELTPIIS